jgi:hypothetical protein
MDDALDRAKGEAKTLGRELVEGCLVQGSVLVRKVPGNVHFLPESVHHSYDNENINMSHTVHHLSFGVGLSPYSLSKFSPAQRSKLAALDGKAFPSAEANTTHDHYIKVVGSDFKFVDTRMHVQAYQFTSSWNKYVSPDSHETPMVKFNYDLSPM